MNWISRRGFLEMIWAGAVVLGTRSCMNNLSQPTEKSQMWEQALGYSIDCMRRNLSQVTGFPEFTEDGRWHCADDGGWVGGHWVGLLWLAYEYTHDPAFKRSARAWASRLAPRQDDQTTH